MSPAANVCAGLVIANFVALVFVVGAFLTIPLAIGNFFQVGVCGKLACALTTVAAQSLRCRHFHECLLHTVAGCAALGSK